MNIRDFLRSHPKVIAAVEGVEHAVLDAAAEFIEAEVRDRLGFISKVLPVDSVIEGLKAKAEGIIDGALDGASDPNASLPPPTGAGKLEIVGEVPSAPAIDVLDKLKAVLGAAKPSKPSPAPSPFPVDPILAARQARRAQDIAAQAEGAESDNTGRQNPRPPPGFSNAEAIARAEAADTGAKV